MSDQPETLADIVAQMRRWNKEGATLVNTGYIADRIERAAKNTENAFGMALAIEDGLRKRDKQSAPGNAAAMRAALESIEDDCRVLDRKDMWEEEVECYYDALRDIREKVSASLAAPPEPPSNAAALRVALENARSKFIHIKKCADECEVSRKKLAILCEFASQEITAALAAPARNVDRFKTAEEAIQAYAAKCDGDDHPDFGMFGYWLFAPAKGGAK